MSRSGIFTVGQIQRTNCAGLARYLFWISTERTGDETPRPKDAAHPPSPLHSFRCKSIS
jgi:hypothetical protein